MNLWLYVQSSGKLYKNGEYVERGYSGFGAGKNNLETEHIKNVGPIPAGIWRMRGPRDSVTKGPHCFDLNPIAHKAHGRSAFMIHGDSIKHPGMASEGCIILPRVVREMFGEGDFLMVVANDP